MLNDTYNNQRSTSAERSSYTTLKLPVDLAIISRVRLIRTAPHESPKMAILTRLAFASQKNRNYAVLIGAWTKLGFLNNY